MKKKLTFPIGIIVILLNACSAPKYIYAPNTTNLLTVDKKNNLKVAANYSNTRAIGETENARSAGLDLQTAFGITKRVAIKADYFTKKESNQTGVNQNGVPYDQINYKRNGIEISGGIYNFSKTKTKSAFNIYSGIGTGHFSFEEKYNGNRFDNYSFSIRYYKFFVQPGVLVHVTKGYQLSFASRLSLFKFYQMESDYPNLYDESSETIISKPSVFTDFIIHHEFSFKALPGIHFQLQHGISSLNTSFRVKNESSSAIDQYDYHNAWIALGIIADMNKLFNRKQSKND